MHTQTGVLEKGFNFALSPKSLPLVDIICGVEKGLRKVNDAAAVSTFYRSFKSRRSIEDCATPQKKYRQRRGTSFERVKRGQRHRDLKADEGNYTVTMDMPDYNQKINALLNDNNIYSKLVTKRNPLSNITKDVNDCIPAFAG